MGFQAAALGNHELDLGPRALASIIAAEHREGALYVRAAFPYLSANLGLTDDPALQPLVAPHALRAPLAAGSLARSVILELDGEAIGIVGATTPQLAWTSSAGGVTVEPADGFDLDALAEVIQQAVDDLTGQGVDKIILLAHMQQIAIEQRLASRLKGVDIIVAGGSNTLLADKTDRLRSGHRAAGSYPLRMRSATGDPLSTADEVVFAPPAGNPASGKRAGDISRFSVESVLRFNNGLVIVPITARQLVDLLEHGVGFDGVGEFPDGRFPQVAGVRFSFDPAEPPGRRIRSLAIIDDQDRLADRVVENGVLVGDTERTIHMAVLNFTANGDDGYPFALPARRRIDLAGEAGQYNPPSAEFPDTNGNGLIDDPVAVDPGLVDFAAPGTEQDALAEYLARFYRDTPFGWAETSPDEDRRIQNLGLAGARDTVFESAGGR